MTDVSLIRHGQAGPRDDYDRLSALGQKQARHLGNYLANSPVEFTALITGGLARQQATAQAVVEARKSAGRPPIEIRSDPRWNEFDLDALYEAFASRLREDDARFRREHDDILASLADPTHALHREHHYCDIEVIRAWVLDRYEFEGESWGDFRARIASAADDLAATGAGPVAVFTSATPVAIGAAAALGLDDLRLWRLAGVTYNTSISSFAREDGSLRLVSFNGVPHLPDPKHWTRR